MMKLLYFPFVVNRRPRSSSRASRAKRTYSPIFAGSMSSDSSRAACPLRMAFQVLLQEYLVQTDRFRLLACRRFGEASGEHWTLEHLELHHGEYLYQQAPLHEDRSAVAMRYHDPRLLGIRTRFCEHACAAEDLAPLRLSRTLFIKHGHQDALSLQYPGATLLKDSLPHHMLGGYRDVLRGRTLPGMGSRCMTAYRHVGRHVPQKRIIGRLYSHNAYLYLASLQSLRNMYGLLTYTVPASHT